MNQYLSTSTQMSNRPESDKPMKEAIMQGNVVALNQRDVYDSSAGASSEYWEKKDVTATQCLYL